MNTLAQQKDLIEKLVTSIFEASPNQKNKCDCHVIDCQKTDILMWPFKNQPNTFLVKIANQKFVSILRTDKKGGIYWKYRNFYEEEEVKNSEPVEIKESPNPANPESEAIRKFQARQAQSQPLPEKTNDHESNTSENNSS